MPTLVCPHCGGINADTNAQCHHCGGDIRATEMRLPPRPFPTKRVIFVVLMLGALGMCSEWNKRNQPPPKSAAQVAAEQAEQDAKAAREADDCRKNLRCWAGKWSIDAEVACTRAVERLPRFQIEWTDGMLEPKFSKMAWADEKAGLVKYIGDKARMQNGFGAWQNVVYTCNFDPASGMVVDAQATPGRL